MSKESNPRRLIASAIVLLTLGASSVFAGDLNPPVGPIAPTMRTLDEVEPRTIVNLTNTPGDLTATYVISQPGSYYLIEDVLGEFTKHGIRIDVRNVTLDLNGFRVDLPQLRGVSPSVNGIHAWPDTGESGAVTIRNGHVSGWNNGVGLLGPGVIADIATWGNGAGINTIGGSVLRCTADSNQFGILISQGTAEDCVCTGNFATGFSGVQSSLTRCISNNSTQEGFLMLDGASLRDCSATGNMGGGIDLRTDSVAIGCRSYTNTGNGFTLWNSIARDCTAALNTFNGFEILGDSTLFGCLARANSSNGFSAILLPSESVTPVSLFSCISRNNSLSGFAAGDHASYEGCISEKNLLDGFLVGNDFSARDCTARSNGDDGFQFGQGSSISGCLSAENAFGFFAPVLVGSGSRIDSNTASDNTNTGFLISADNCVVVRNVAHGNGTDYTVNPISQLGDIITSFGFVGTVGPWVNFGTPIIAANEQIPPRFVPADKR